MRRNALRLLTPYEVKLMNPPYARCLTDLGYASRAQVVVASIGDVIPVQDGLLSGMAMLRVESADRMHRHHMYLQRPCVVMPPERDKRF